MYIKVRAV